MRLRLEHRIRKRLRRLRHSALPATVGRAERKGLPLTDVLQAAMLDEDLSHVDRAEAGRLQAIAGVRTAADTLLQQFYRQTGPAAHNTALALEDLGDRRAVRPLCRVLLTDDDPHRRRAAARVLGWMWRPGRIAARTLAQCVVDPSQPDAAREEAAESLAYAGTQAAVEPLLTALRDGNANLRFWAVSGLGMICRWRPDERAIRALEGMLHDTARPYGWWAIGKDALGILARMEPPVADYRAKLAVERDRVLADPESAESDRRWAENYR